MQNPFAYLCFSKTHALSPDGRCRPFDAAADGIVISEGVARRRAQAAGRRRARRRPHLRRDQGRRRVERRPRQGPDRAAARGPGARAARGPTRRRGVSPATRRARRGARHRHRRRRPAPRSQALAGCLRATPAARRSGCAVGSVKSMIGHTKCDRRRGRPDQGRAGAAPQGAAADARRRASPTRKARLRREPVLPEHARRGRGSAAAAQPAPRRRQRLRLRRHQLPRRARGVHRRASRAPRARRSTAGRPSCCVWRGDAATALAAAVCRRCTPRWSSGAQPALADLARTLADAGRRRPAGERGARGRRRVARRPARQARQRPATCCRRRRARARHAGVHFAERRLDADGPGRVPVPRPGLAVRRHGARARRWPSPRCATASTAPTRVLAGRLERPLSRYVFPPSAFTPTQDSRPPQAELTDTRRRPAGPRRRRASACLRAAARPRRASRTWSPATATASSSRSAAAGRLDDDDLLQLSEARGRVDGREAADRAPARWPPSTPRPRRSTSCWPRATSCAANLNAPRQTVLSGPVEAVERRDRLVRASATSGAAAAGRLRVPLAARRARAAPLRRGARARRRWRRRVAGVLQHDRRRATPTTRPRSPSVLRRPSRAARRVRARGRGDVRRRRARVRRGRAAVACSPGWSAASSATASTWPCRSTGRAGPGSPASSQALAALASEGVPVQAQRLFDGRSAPRLDLTDLGPRRAARTRSRRACGRSTAGAPARPTRPPPARAPHPPPAHHDPRRSSPP